MRQLRTMLCTFLAACLPVRFAYADVAWPFSRTLHSTAAGYALLAALAIGAAAVVITLILNRKNRK